MGTARWGFAGVTLVRPGRGELLRSFRNAPATRVACLRLDRAGASLWEARGALEARSVAGDRLRQVSGGLRSCARLLPTPARPARARPPQPGEPGAPLQGGRVQENEGGPRAPYSFL